MGVKKGLNEEFKWNHNRFRLLKTHCFSFRGKESEHNRMIEKRDHRFWKTFKIMLHACTSQAYVPTVQVDKKKSWGK